MAEEKPVTPVDKKVVAEKKAEEAKVPVAESKVATEKKAVETKVAPVEKKPVAEKKVEQHASAEEKVPEKVAKTEAPSAEEKKEAGE